MKGFMAVVVAILVMGPGVLGYLYSGAMSRVDNTQNELTSLRNQVTALGNQITGSQKTAQGTPAALVMDGVHAAAGIQPSVVRIDVTGNRFQAAGSGFFVGAKGYVLTNNHVIDQATSIQVTLMNGDSLSASVVQNDVNLDLAVL